MTTDKLEDIRKALADAKRCGAKWFKLHVTDAQELTAAVWPERPGKSNDRSGRTGVCGVRVLGGNIRRRPSERLDRYGGGAMSEVDDLEAYETPAGHPVDKHTAQAFKNYGNRYRNARER
jgi:hypothetical protein